MTPKSIRSHLAPYSILGKRKTTIAHAFASALAPTDDYDKERVESALFALGQANLQQLTCVYCGRLARTWDHLVNLVQDGELNGFGHQLGNLVPCCRECNSEKGSTPYTVYVNGLGHLSDQEKVTLLSRLDHHLQLAKPIPKIADTEVLERFNNLRKQIYELMQEADKCASILRNAVNA